MAVDSELKPLKDNKKKEGDKKVKKQQGERKTEPKPKPPKTIEGAVEIVSNLLYTIPTSLILTFHICCCERKPTICLPPNLTAQPFPYLHILQYMFNDLA